MLLERSPNELVQKIFPDVVVPKVAPRPKTVEGVVSRLPVDSSQYLGVAGTGDYSHGGSTYGSVALRYESGVVIKVRWAKCYTKVKVMVRRKKVYFPEPEG